MALVQSSTSNSQYGVGTLTDAGISFTAGNLGILVVSYSNGFGDGIPSAPAGWSVLKASTRIVAAANAGFFTGAIAFYRANMPSGSSAPSVTVGFAGARIRQFEFSGYSASVTVDTTDEDTGGPGTTVTVGPVTPSAGNKLVIAGVSVGGIGGISSAGLTDPPTGMTSLLVVNTSVSDMACEWAYKETTSTSGQDATWTWDTSVEWAGVIGVLVDAGGGTIKRNNLPLMGMGR